MSAQTHRIVIQPTRGLVPPRLTELWSYRELFSFLVWRDLKVRYAQTVIGAAWTVFQPLAMMAVYTFAFTKIARVDTHPVPYVLFALSGLVLWTFVSRAVAISTSSLVNEIAIVTKTGAPRVLVPLASVVSNLVDFVIALVLFLIFDAAYGRIPDWRFVFVLPLLALTLVLTIGLGLGLSALNVRYRDVAQAIPFTIQLWFFLTPIAFTLVAGAAWQRDVQALNPLVGIVLAFRWALLGTAVPVHLVFFSVAVTAIVFVIGLGYFSGVDRTIADDV
jgi:lipopolysaccharide transport system permease protein